MTIFAQIRRQAHPITITMHIIYRGRLVESVVLVSGMGIESIGTGFGGCKTKFPNRGGVALLINSIFVGSLEAACRRTEWVSAEEDTMIDC